MNDSRCSGFEVMLQMAKSWSLNHAFELISGTSRIAIFILLVLFSSEMKQLSAQQIISRAIMGEPYGVALVEIPVVNPVSGRDEAPLSAHSFGNKSRGRVLFPVANDSIIEVAPPSERQLPPAGGGRLLERVGELFRELSGDESTRFQTISRRVFFLFEGKEPFRIQLSDEKRNLGEVMIEPLHSPDSRREVLALWWEGYLAQMQTQIDRADYPTVVESYLLATLARQNQMPLPAWFLEADQVDDHVVDTLKLIGGAEEVSDSIFRLAAAGIQNHSSIVGQALPEAPIWQPVKVTDPANLPKDVESIASRVPPECFYIRYGSFSNYLWFKDLSEANGGDISKLVTLRGVERNLSGRVENQLAFRMTQLSRVLGGTLVQDQAVIGRDLYLSDGAALGVLFQSANPTLLHASMRADRQKIAAEQEEVALRDVEVAGRKVSFLSRADGKVRSFLAVDGEYLLVTNSRHLLERFFEVAQTKKSLAVSKSFLVARRYMPLSRDDTVFAYFSPEMFQGLVSPQYMIELRRRLFAKADLVMVHLARILARANASTSRPIESRLESNLEQKVEISIDELVNLQLLPPRFGDRFDGSGVFEVGEQFVDSLRGGRGTFLPICDVEFSEVTREEADWYQRIAATYSGRFENFDPVMVGVQRQIADGESVKQKITIHAEVAPWDPGKYGELTKQLGPPTRTEMLFAPDDIVTVQANVASDWLGPPTHLFAAIKDTIPPDPSRFSGVLRTYFSLKQIPGYLGAWPQPGALDRLPLGLGRGRQIGPGMTKLVGGLYRYNDGEFSVVSFHPEVLKSSLSHLAATDSDSSAQLRVQIGDLGGSQLKYWVNQQLYQRASESSLAGANYLDLLSRSMPIKPENAPAVAEEILDAKIQCALGGEYQTSYRDVTTWVSSAWGQQTPPEEHPDSYQAPILRWLHGLDARVTQLDDRLVVDLSLDLE